MKPLEEMRLQADKHDPKDNLSSKERTCWHFGFTSGWIANRKQEKIIVSEMLEILENLITILEPLNVVSLIATKEIIAKAKGT